MSAFTPSSEHRAPHEYPRPTHGWPIGRRYTPGPGLRADRVPRKFFDLADSLEILNLTGNALSSLPDDLHRLTHLRVLFCSDNAFTELPQCWASAPS